MEDTNTWDIIIILHWVLYFYNCFSPWFEVNIKLLRILQRRYHRKIIPTPLWTTDLLDLFQLCKTNLTSSPVLARFDSNKPAFLNTDWSAEGMGYILLQPDDSVEAVSVTKLLLETGECLFELLPTSPRLRAVTFNPRGNKSYEQSYRSFVGKTTCGRWVINHLRRYLWGVLFF